MTQYKSSGGTYQFLNNEPWFSFASPSMIQHARWHISCDSVFLIRSAI